MKSHNEIRARIGGTEEHPLEIVAWCESGGDWEMVVDPEQNHESICDQYTGMMDSVTPWAAREELAYVLRQMAFDLIEESHRLSPHTVRMNREGVGQLSFDPTP